MYILNKIHIYNPINDEFDKLDDDDDNITINENDQFNITKDTSDNLYLSYTNFTTLYYIPIEKNDAGNYILSDSVIDINIIDSNIIETKEYTYNSFGVFYVCDISNITLIQKFNILNQKERINFKTDEYDISAVRQLKELKSYGSNVVILDASLNDTFTNIWFYNTENNKNIFPNNDDTEDNDTEDNQFKKIDFFQRRNINIKTTSIGNNHILFVDYSDNIWSWGDNSYGQLGRHSYQNGDINTINIISDTFMNVFIG